MATRPERTWRLAAGYSAWMVVLAAGYFARPDWHLVTWGLIGLSCVGGIIAGIVLYRPARIWPWLLLAAANLAYSAGDTVFNVLTTYFGAVNPFPSVADALYLATYPLFAIGLTGFNRYRTGRDMGAVIDALIVTGGVALLSWVFLIRPMRAEDDPLSRIIGMAYPLGDVLMLLMLARLVFSPDGIRNPSVRLLTIGTAGILGSDVAYGLLQLNGRWVVGSGVDSGWLLFYWAWGLAALWPSMVGLTEPLARKPVGLLPLSRLILISTTALIPPVLLLVEVVIHDQSFVRAGIGATIVLFTLVILRLGGVVRTHRRAVARERALRASAADLVGALDYGQIRDRVGQAVGRLVPAGVPHRTLAAVGRDDLMVEVTDDPAPLTWRRDSIAATREVRLGRVPTTITPAADLPTPLADRVGGSGSVLICALAARQVSATQPGGVLIVGAERTALAASQDALETLAAQIALAVGRVDLAEEVGRRKSEAYFRTLVHNSFDVILIVDEGDIVRYASPSAAAMFGEPPQPGQLLPDLVGGTDRSRVVASLGRMRAYDSAEGHEEWRLSAEQDSDGEVFWEVRYANLASDPTVRGLVLTLRDVTARRRLEAELRYRAFHDPLTGLANRPLFADRVAHALARARRTGKLAAVIFVDLDDFKIVNDTLGHSAGDGLLVAVANRLAGSVRSADTAARLGGDEFALLLEDVDSMDDLERIAAALTDTLALPYTLTDGTTRATASVGIATSAESGDVDEMLRHADLAVYAAKAAGRRQWCRFQPELHTGMLESRALSAQLEEAVRSDEFRLRYQPIVELADDRIVAMEALARWPTRRHGVVLPERFITLAEETGHIVQLGAWVLERATADLASWRHGRNWSTPPYVSVNVSARQLHDGGFVAAVRAALESAQLPGEALVLELTESVLMGRHDQVEADLRALKALGVRLAIDDFGTGYSSLSYLRELPIDVIKIDKSFVRGIARSEQDLRLMEGIIRITDTFGVQLIAEGIETAQQRDLLIEIGCGFGQGYLFSKPVPPNEAARLLAASNDR
jgi:diguanylate cyclase (GGDEF)-like protein/PAS domain S-box-containing protein